MGFFSKIRRKKRITTATVIAPLFAGLVLNQPAAIGETGRQSIKELSSQVYQEPVGNIPLISDNKINATKTISINKLAEPPRKKTRKSKKEEHLTVIDVKPQEPKDLITSLYDKIDSELDPSAVKPSKEESKIEVTDDDAVYKEEKEESPAATLVKPEVQSARIQPVQEKTPEALSAPATAELPAPQEVKKKESESRIDVTNNLDKITDFKSWLDEEKTLLDKQVERRKIEVKKSEMLKEIAKRDKVADTLVTLGASGDIQKSTSYTPLEAGSEMGFQNGPSF